MKIFTITVSLLLSTQMLIGQLGQINLSEALQKGSGDTYGTYCGIAATQPAARKFLEKMVLERDLEGLSRWLESPNLVYQTYAAEGLIRLSAIISITPTQSRQIERVKLKKDRIPTCSGCVIEDLTIAECLAGVEPGYNINTPRERGDAPRG